MKAIRLTCDAWPKPRRFLIEVDELTGDATIVDETAARVDRDNSVHMSTGEGEGEFVRLAVEVAS